MKKLNLLGYFATGIGALLFAENLDSKFNQKNIIDKVNIREEQSTGNNIPHQKLNFPLSKLFESENIILREQLKNNYHISIPFNRKIKYIYNLDNFYYMDYENYNFNKLSDLFLNIHIFIN